MGVLLVEMIATVMVVKSLRMDAASGRVLFVLYRFVAVVCVEPLAVFVSTWHVGRIFRVSCATFPADFPRRVLI